ncbi:MAG: hypothetical protein AAFS10_06090 [Myxococcota bacterium]
MNEISDATWTYLLQDLLKHREVMASHSQLSDFVEDFESVLEDLEESAKEASDEDKELERLKHSVRDADDAHDDAHRAFFRILEAFMFHGDAADRQVVEHGLRALYPERLSIVSASFAEEIDNTEQFAQHIATDVVQASLAVIRREVSGIDGWAQACVDRGRELAAQIQALETHKAQAATQTQSASADLLSARGQVQRVWRLFMQTMDFAYAPGNTENDELREMLLGRYFREINASS